MFESTRRIKASMRIELNKKLFLREGQKYLELKVCKKWVDKLLKSLASASVMLPSWIATNLCKLHQSKLIKL